MYAAVVIPCLNEERTLTTTCQSLGFEPSSVLPERTVLILVDNGSTDGTHAVMQNIKEVLPAGVVVLAREEERGFVPPRHRGALVARQFAQERGLKEDEMVILQADADTTYRDGYVLAMLHAASKHGPGFFFEGISESPHQKSHPYTRYFEISSSIDRSTMALLSRPTEDIVIDDKVAGYFLSDYFAVGGHKRAYNNAGDEIHAETSRLYIRSRIAGAQRVKVEGAVAQHSLRHVGSDLALHFSTAGFPREASWCQAWRTEYKGPGTVSDFCDPRFENEVGLAVRKRRAHLFLLFSLLPTYFAGILGRTSDFALDPITRKFVALLPRRNVRQLESDPSLLFQDGFALIEAYAPELDEALTISR